MIINESCWWPLRCPSRGINNKLATDGWTYWTYCEIGPKFAVFCLGFVLAVVAPPPLPVRSFALCALPTCLPLCTACAHAKSAPGGRTRKPMHTQCTHRLVPARAVCCSRAWWSSSSWGGAAGRRDLSVCVCVCVCAPCGNYCSFSQWWARQAPGAQDESAARAHWLVACVCCLCAAPGARLDLSSQRIVVPSGPSSEPTGVLVQFLPAKTPPDPIGSTGGDDGSQSEIKCQIVRVCRVSINLRPVQQVAPQDCSDSQAGGGGWRASNRIGRNTSTHSIANSSIHLGPPPCLQDPGAS